MDYITIDNKDYKRVNKTLARRLYGEGKSLLLYPIKANPYSMWIQPYKISIDDIDIKDKYPPSFDTRVNSFEAYNCNSELGTYTKFYILDDDRIPLF